MVLEAASSIVFSYYVNMNDKIRLLNNKWLAAMAAETPKKSIASQINLSHFIRSKVDFWSKCQHSRRTSFYCFDMKLLDESPLYATLYHVVYGSVKPLTIIHLFWLRYTLNHSNCMVGLNVCFALNNIVIHHTITCYVKLLLALKYEIGCETCYARRCCEAFDYKIKLTTVN